MFDNIDYYINWFLPRICVGCGFKSDNLYLELCSYCKQQLPWALNGCYRCGVQLRFNNAIVCEQCTQSPPAFDRLCALFMYRAPITKLIYSLKVAQQLFVAKLFAHLLNEAILQRWYAKMALPQAIIPVPLHSKQSARGFHHIIDIGKFLAKGLYIPLDLKLCTRIKNTLPQKSFSAKLAAYDHVAILDDVVSTGATVRAMSIALQKSGVKNIDVWCICRR